MDLTCASTKQHLRPSRHVGWFWHDFDQQGHLTCSDTGFAINYTSFVIDFINHFLICCNKLWQGAMKFNENKILYSKGKVIWIRLLTG